MSPNTVSRFAKHVATLGTFLGARDKSFEQITIGDDDQFLAWLEHRRTHAVSPNIIRFQRAAHEDRHWFLDSVTFLGSAARRFPESWPSLNIDKRAARKLGRGRTSPPREYLFERAEGSRDRAMPIHIAEAIAAHVHKLPDPCPLLFMLAVAIGAQAEDLHARSSVCDRAPRRTRNRSLPRARTARDGTAGRGGDRTAVRDCSASALPGAVRHHARRARSGADGVELSALQRHAVRMAVTNELSVLCGGAGTGKTTTLRAVIAAAKAVHGDAFPVHLAALSGRAAALVLLTALLQLADVGHRIVDTLAVITAIFELAEAFTD